MINDNYYKEMLETLYAECSSHLKQQANKRDQILIIYISLLTLAVGSLAQLYDFDSVIALALMLFMYFVGCVSYCIILLLRSWHIQYTKCCEVIMGMLISPKEYNDFCSINSFIKEYMNEPNEKNKTSEPNIPFFLSVENMMLILFLIIIIIPLLLFWYFLSISFVWRCLILIIHFSCGTLLMYRVKIFAKRHFTWILDFDKYK